MTSMTKVPVYSWIHTSKANDSKQPVKQNEQRSQANNMQLLWWENKYRNWNRRVMRLIIMTPKSTVAYALNNILCNFFNNNNVHLIRSTFSLSSNRKLGTFLFSSLARNPPLIIGRRFFLCFLFSFFLFLYILLDAFKSNIIIVK